MTLGELSLLCESLAKVIVNLRKDGPNRKRSKEAAEEKVRVIEEIYQKFRLLNNSIAGGNLTVLEKEQLSQLIDRVRRYKSEGVKRIQDSIIIETDSNVTDEETETETENNATINTTANNTAAVNNIPAPNTTTENPQPENITENTAPDNKRGISITMANFDYGRAQKLPGLNIDKDENRDEQIRDFLNNVEFYHDTLTATEQTILIKFLLKCKIQGRSLTELGQTPITNFHDLSTQLKKKCGNRDSIESITNKLNNVRQQNRPMRTLITEIEGLLARKTELEVNTQTESARPVLHDINEKLGLTYLKKGVNERYKIILDSARHSTFQEASQHLLEIDPGITCNETIRYAINRSNNNAGTSRANGNPNNTYDERINHYPSPNGYNREFNGTNNRYNNNNNNNGNNNNYHRNNYHNNYNNNQNNNRNYNQYNNNRTNNNRGNRQPQQYNNNNNNNYNRFNNNNYRNSNGGRNPAEMSNQWRRQNYNQFTQTGSRTNEYQGYQNRQPYNNNGNQNGRILLLDEEPGNEMSSGGNANPPTEA